MDLQKIENMNVILKNDILNLKNINLSFFDNYATIKNLDKDGLKIIDNYFIPLENECTEIQNLSIKNFEYSKTIKEYLEYFTRYYQEAENLSIELEKDFQNVENNNSEINKLIDNWENKTLQLKDELLEVNKAINLANSCCNNSIPKYEGMEERQLEKLFIMEEVKNERKKYISDQDKIDCLKDIQMKEATKFIQKETEKKNTYTILMNTWNEKEK